MGFSLNGWLFRPTPWSNHTGAGARNPILPELITQVELRPVYRTLNEVAVNAAWAGLKIPMAPVVAPAGIVTRTRVSLMTFTVAFCAAPTHARFVPVKPVPFNVTTVPTRPDLGEKLEMLCCG